MKTYDKIVGTHNSMTYLPVKKWWMWPMNIVAKCQSKSLSKQIECGVAFFDIRIRFDKCDKWEIAHGLVSYKYNVNKLYGILGELNSHLDKNYVFRIILESDKDDLLEVKTFKDFCSRLEMSYPNVKFVGGYRKIDWKRIYDFGDDDFEYDQWCASMQSAGLWPWFYAKCHNKEHLKEDIPESKYKYHLIDFL